MTPTRFDVSLKSVMGNRRRSEGRVFARPGDSRRTRAGALSPPILRSALVAFLAVGPADHALAQEPAVPPPARDAANAVHELLTRAGDATRRGEWREALAACEEALKLAPKDIDAHSGRLLSLVALGRYPQARSALEEFGDAVPSRVVDVAGHVLSAYGDLRGARSLFERCVDDLQPRNPFCWAGLVGVLSARGEDQEAMSRARAALDGGAYPGGLSAVWDALRETVVLQQDRDRIEKAIGRPFPTLRDRASLATPRAETDLPLQFERDWPLVAARLDGRPARFVVDTGADHLHIRRSLAKKIGLRITGKTEVVVEGGDGTVTEDRGIARELRLGDVVFRNVPVNVSDDAIAPGDGVLGVALLKEFLIDLDFPEKRLRLRPVDRDVATAFGPLPRGISSVQFVVMNRLPFVPVRINGRLDGWFLLDTGGQGNLFNTLHLDRLGTEGGVFPIPAPDPENPGHTVGVGGRTAVGYVGPLRVNLGPYVTDFTHVPSARFLVDPGIWTFGAWGMEHLEDYRLILDYRKRRLLIHTPHADEQLTKPGIVSIEHTEPALASRIGLR